MNAEQITKLLEDVKGGAVDIEDAVSKLRHLPFEDVGLVFFIAFADQYYGGQSLL